MKQTVKVPQVVPDALRSLYAPVRDELDEVEEALRKELQSDYPFVDRLVQHGFRLGGKRLRPALVLLSAKACGNLKPEHIVLATAVELVHTATLVHDDVLDEAAIRRHLDTVNARWNNEASILLGDYLFARSICMTATLEDPFACRVIGEAAQTMCEGELRQVETRGNYALTEEDYLDIIGDKTAALIACCCRLGAHYADADEDDCELLARFGHHLGVAFQIADDLLDVLGDEQTTGKSLGTDILKQKPTLPLIRLLHQAEDQQRAELIDQLSSSENHHAELLRGWFDRTDALAYARDKAIAYTRKAGDELESFPPTPARDVMRGLTDFVVTRNK